MKQKLHFRWLLSIVLCCISFVTQAATVNIAGCTATQQISGYPLFVGVPSSITVSTSLGNFNCIYVDDVQVAYKGNSYWSSYSLNISSYLDGQRHKLQLKGSSSDYGICYFQSGEVIFVDGLSYSVGGTEATLVGVSSSIENAYIPEECELDGVKYPVVGIANYALSECHNLKTVTIPNSIKTIGASAFCNCFSLTSITIPESVISIGESAFEGCSALTTLVFNAENCSTCGSSFYPAFPSKIETLTIGNKVTQIPSYFLRNGSRIVNLNIPNSVTYIGTEAFRYSNYLKGVVIPNQVNSIESYAFYGCNSLVKNAYPSNLSNPFPSGVSISYPAECIIEDNVIYDTDKTTVYYAPTALSQNYSIPSSVVVIGSNAFYKCSALTAVTIPESVTSIGNSAFNGCTALETLTIPESIISIGESAFNGCTALATLTFNAENCSTCGSSLYPAFPSTIETLTIGNKVTRIPSYFLCNGSRIVNLNIPNSVTYIGTEAFRYSNYLKGVVIPNQVNSIGSHAFEGCNSLVKNAYPSNLSKPFLYGVSISYPKECTVEDNWIFNTDKTTIYYAPLTLSSNYSIPSTITYIGTYAFYKCSALTSVIIPEAVTSIGTYAFDGCTSLATLTFNAENCTSCGSSSAPAFPSSISTLTFGNKVTKVPDYLLYNGSRIETLTIPNSVTSIGSYAFRNSMNLRSLTLGSGLLSIGDKAFSYETSSSSTNYSNIQIAKVFWLGNTPPTNYSAISADVNYVANDQYSLSNQKKYQFLSSKFLVDGTIYVPVSPSERTCDVIDCEYSLQNGDIVISDKVINRGVELSVLDINNFSFYRNQTITSLTISNKGILGNKAFYNCDALLNAVVNNVGAIGNSAFEGCKSINTVSLGNSITTIGNRAFNSCSSLPTISIPSNVTSIGESIFYGCSKLTTVNIGAGIVTVPQYAFANCSTLNNVSIPNNVKRIGNYVFSGCRSLANLRFEDDEQAEEEIPNNPSTQTFGDWTSTNHSEGSTSYKEYTMTVISGDRLTFNYSVDSEFGYDYLVIQLNGVEVVKESGNKSGIYTKTFTEAGDVSLYLSYTKDDSQSSGQDKASVYNISLNDNGTIYNNLQLGSNGSNPLFADCPLDVVYIGRSLSYNTDSNSGYSPFYRNTSLSSVEITDAETKIYDNEFYGCTNLKTLKIGNGVKTIGRWAFSGCSSLDYFSAGYHVESIGEEAFSDCTGLTNYYSFSILPPVCGNQALDDINKWECTLFVPAESSDEYMAADQWKDFFFVNENDAVLIETIRINVESLDGKTGDTFQLVADILPGNATRKTVEWSSSDTSVAIIDATGLISFVKEGNTTITARATDGSGIEASIEVVVTVKEPELGDSNANGVVNIADAVNIANYAIGNEVEHFNETAADVNRDGIITLADASATITLILDQPVAASTIAKVRGLHDTIDQNSDILIIDDFAAKLGETATVSVALDNTIDYVALQADVVVPDGISLVSINIGNRAEMNHSLTVKRIDDRTMRVALFDLGNSIFANNNEAIIELVVKVNGATTDSIEIGNIIASDANAHEYILTSTGGNNTEMSGIESIDWNNIHIEPTANSIEIYNAEGCNVAIYAIDGVLLTHFVATSERESCKVATGMYLVCVGTKAEKVMVK